MARSGNFPDSPDPYQRWRDFRRERETQRERVEIGVSLLVLVIFALAALRPGWVEPIRLDDALDLVLAWITLLFSLRLARALDEGDRPGVETAWGGLGGGFGGWRLTRSAVFLFAALAFGMLLASRF